MRLLPALLVAAVTLAVLGEPAGAQVRPRPRTPPPAPRARPQPAPDTAGARARDTIPGRPGRDTTRAAGDSAQIRWVEEDSVTRALLNRPGYTVTRYQGPILTFDALTRAIDIFIGIGDTSRVAVQRDNRLIVADTSITYSEETGIARATGRVFVREGESELTGLGGEYNLRERSVTIRGGRTQVQTEENWFVSADALKIVQADTTNRQNYFGRHGNLTSCDLAEHGGTPHYHFAFTEIKRTAGNTMVARPAVLYISDIPVLWLPFVFQDMRPGRRSGLLTPRLGIQDFIRNSPSAQRSFENIGYYWAISDYMDLEASLDWLSDVGRREGEAPGLTRYNLGWRYNWVDRFLSGNLGTTLTRQGNGSENLAVSWLHRQEFTRDRKVQSNVNWVQSTVVQRQTNINPLAVLATISSSVSLSDRIGPARVELGATRKQFSGRKEVEQTFPTLAITTGTLNLTPWFAWTPSFRFNEQRRMHLTQPSQLGLIFGIDEAGRLKADSIRQNTRTTTASFDTPIEIFGYNLSNSFRFHDRELDFPQLIRVVNPEPGQPATDRVFARTYETTLDWTPSFALPSFAPGTWKVSPSVSLQNVYGQAPFMVRSQLTGGEWLTQTKRPTFGLTVAPTFYGLFPGFAGFSRFRHAITSQFSYQYAPSAGVSDEFLLAQQTNPRDYIGAIPQNQFSLTLGTNLEGKGRPAAGDTTATAESAAKVKLLSLRFSPLSYDVSRYQKTKRLIRGFTSNSFSASADSELLPGLDLSLDWSLFAGDNFNSDTAVFSPYLERVAGSFSLNAKRNPLMLLYRLFGRAVPADHVASAEIVEPLDDAEARAASALPIAGTRARQPQMVVAPKEAWEATIAFSSSRQRPPRGGNIIDYDPTALCQPLFAVNRIAYDNCVARAQVTPVTDEPVTSPQAGGAFYRVPPTTSITTAIRFNLTPKWAGSWSTSYDVERSEFASHVVSLQRDLHDWRANFNFTQSPTGSFAFTFFISLKAEPDLKFDYNRATYRQDVQVP